jgi:RNA polymerase-interacting CarD/CdnL/TRCF family regulator
MYSMYEKSSVIYVPVDAKDITLNMRHIMSREEADEAVIRAKSSSNIWRDDVKERAGYFDQLFDSGCCSDILWLWKVLSLYKTDTENSRRRIYASDARILAAAEKIITEEFSFALGIDRSEVLPYIGGKLYK